MIFFLSTILANSYIMVAGTKKFFSVSGDSIVLTDASRASPFIREEVLGNPTKTTLKVNNKYVGFGSEGLSVLRSSRGADSELMFVLTPDFKFSIMASDNECLIATDNSVKKSPCTSGGLGTQFDVKIANNPNWLIDKHEIITISETPATTGQKLLRDPLTDKSGTKPTLEDIKKIGLPYDERMAGAKEMPPLKSSDNILKVLVNILETL